MDNPNFYIGLLSGTSLDAIDAAIIDFSKQQPKLIHTIEYPIPPEFKANCLKITETGTCHIETFGQLDQWAGELFAQAVQQLLKQAQIGTSHITAIGSHGQTLWHAPRAPRPFTLQIGDPNLISQLTNITTIADFRRKDIAVGGQGAPLAPAFHQSLFQSNQELRVIVNIGGISNLSILFPSQNTPPIGFDCGPGNCLMDSWAKRHFDQTFDCSGKIAQQGTVHPELLNDLLSDPYFDLPYPKSTGREYFNLTWLESYLNSQARYSLLPPVDVQATLLMFTVHGIQKGIEQAIGQQPFSLYLCGGGAHNNHLSNQLSILLGQTIQTTEVLGLPIDWVEATLFAWLAKQAVEGKTGNIPSITGAKHPVKLGGIYYASN